MPSCLWNQTSNRMKWIFFFQFITDHITLNHYLHYQGSHNRKAAQMPNKGNYHQRIERLQSPEWCISTAWRCQSGVRGFGCQRLHSGGSVVPRDRPLVHQGSRGRRPTSEVRRETHGRHTTSCLTDLTLIASRRRSWKFIGGMGPVEVNMKISRS